MARETLWQVYGNRRMAVLLALGFSSGLPLMLTGVTLQAWVHDARWSLETITLFGSLVTLPYSLKFFWSPLMDRYAFPILGRRRGWLLVTQALLAAAILAMAVVGPVAKGSNGETSKIVAAKPAALIDVNQVYILAAAAALVAFLSASQDIVADAYRTDVLPPDERGAGAAVFTMGYRVGLIVGGSGALILSPVGWKPVYVALALTMVVGLIATLFAPEPTAPPAPPKTLFDAVAHPILEMLRRSGAVQLLLFVVLFKLPEVLVKTMPTLLMQDLQFSNREVGLTQQGLGILVTIIGALVGGGLAARMGLRPALWLFGILGAVSNAGYMLLALVGKNYAVMIAAVVTENFCAGLVTAGFVAFLMSQCDARYSATQYALLTSLMSLAGSFAGAPTGWFVKQYGYSRFFAMTILIGLPGMALLYWIREPGGAAGSAKPQALDGG